MNNYSCIKVSSFLLVSKELGEVLQGFISNTKHIHGVVSIVLMKE